MTKKVFIIPCIALSALLVACGGNSKSAECKEKDGREFFSCNLDEPDIPCSELKLSSIIDEPKLILFENTQEALSGFWRCTFSDSYIGVCTPNNKFTLFGHDGKFIRSIGSVGHGPGEYLNTYGACIDEQNGFVYLADMMTRRLGKYTINGEFVGWINSKPISKAVLRCDKEGTLQVVNIPFGPDDTQFIIAPLNAEPKYYPAALDISSRDENGNFIGFNNEIWAYNNTSELSYQITGSDTLYAFNPTDGINYPLITAKSDGKYPFYNNLKEYFLVFVSNEQTPDEIYWVKKKNGKMARGKLINDFLFGTTVQGATFMFKDGWFSQYMESSDLETVLKDLLKEGQLNDKEQKKAKELLEQLKKENQGVMLLGRIKQ